MKAPVDFNECTLEDLYTMNEKMGFEFVIEDGRITDDVIETY